MHDLATGKKSFELRKNDRGYALGDKLIIKGWDPNTEKYNGQEIEAEVTYILKGGHFGLKQGYVIMSIEVINYNF